MGYRSKVAIQMPLEVYHRLREEAEELGFDIFDRELDQEYETKWGDIVLVYDDIKWYTAYDDIEWVETQLNKLEEQKIDYEFIRIGEDCEDYERRGYGDSCNIAFTRKIEIYSIKDCDHVVVV